MSPHVAQHAARRVAPRPVRIAAAVLAAALPVSAVAVNLAGDSSPVASASPAPAAPATGAAVINPAFATLAEATADTYVPEDEAGWRVGVYDSNGNRYSRMEELKVYSPAMDRDIPIVTIRAKEDAENAPTIYLLNGADGGTGRANWLQQTSAIDFYGERIGNVNVVIPMAGAFSYYTDWQEPSVFDTDGNGNGGVQKWETFLTQELPGVMESEHLQTSSDKRAIIGMSMSASSVLVYAEQYPDLYDSVASYSGCASTSGSPANSVDAVFAAKGSQVTYEQMWGDRNGDIALRNDAQLNVGKLANRENNIYISSATGLMGEHDVPSGDRLNGNPVGSITPAVEGGPIEAGANVCTHAFRAAAETAGVTGITFNFRNVGTHQWGYWQDDMFESWPTLARGLGLDEDQARATSEQAAADYLAANPGIGNDGSLPWLNRTLAAAQTEDEEAE
ncbi:alpha/beta hydrolase [Corynebacterium terpenotabidum]|uniref:Uncharacterized protein n=1 Tax=Corynebacterium terpenotabidum Y-11 TaxID=1200352 RepID=S4XGI5_9CORY|nr:alpha/beta hydrolase family protein [Corynebacterium terpenotabidum]AGP31694.1 hypothetical protein A606_10275 [Corynebacterium terpenotabidum Y-11]